MTVIHVVSKLYTMQDVLADLDELPARLLGHHGGHCEGKRQKNSVLCPHPEGIVGGD